MLNLIIIWTCVAMAIMVWAAPIMIAAVTGNFWYIMLYAVWWIPAGLFARVLQYLTKDL